ncbi:MAG TPA: hypothetical protein VF703_01860 [Pyrinomonadaceae bacterium]|jgi:hypothetical protein
MRATRRRQRTPDPLASPDAVRSICEQLRARLSEPIPASEKQLARFLFAIRHIERRPATDTKRGRPSSWPRARLVEAAGQLRAILERETGGRISLNSFIGQYLPILEFPADVVAALSAGQINLQEAAQLARLTPQRLQCSPASARTQRREILRSHVAVQGSQNRLHARVKEILGENEHQAITAGQMTSVVAHVDELLEIDPHDTRHLFWEEMKRLFYAMRDVEQEDLDEEIMGQFLAAMDGVSNVLYRIEKRRRERRRQATNGAREIR